MIRIWRENGIIPNEYQEIEGKGYVCNLFAVSNFCTVFMECKSIEEVKEKFKPDELENRLEDAKKVFSNRKSGKEITETGQEPEKFSDFIEERKKT